MMEQFFGIILMAVVIEGIVTYTKEILEDKHFSWQEIVAIILGVLVAIGYDVDLFALFSMTSKIPFLGQVLTGLLLARGSNYVFELLKKLQGYKNPVQ